jgi:hypothetical protein
MDWRAQFVLSGIEYQTKGRGQSMKPVLIGCCFVASAVLAQPPQVMTFDRKVQPGAAAGAPEGGLGNVWFFAKEDSGGGELVKGAPYSAEATTETVQVLGDGNRIVRKNTSKVYRDGEGRKRTEMTINALGPWASAPITIVTIMDPVAKVMWELDTKERIARKIPMRFAMTGPMTARASASRALDGPASNTPPPGKEDNVTFSRTAHEPEAGMVIADHVGFAPGEPPMAVAGMGPMMTGDAIQAEFKTESLGKSTMEDLVVEGKRMRSAIPAGSIGNDRAIETVHETWSSPELKVVVSSKQTDPRMGDTTYKLSNINRAEPAKSLFAPPADYTVKDGGGPMVIERGGSGPSLTERHELQ